MKILLYGINFSPELTGIGKYTGELAAWLASRGHEVSVVTAPPYYPEWQVHDGYKAGRYRKEIWKGVTVYRVPLWVPKRPSGLKRILHLASFAATSLPVAWWRLAHRPDAVLVVEPPLFCAPATLLGAAVVGSRSWLHVQDFEVDAAFDLGMLSGKTLRKAVLGVERFLMRRFTRVSTISSKMRERLLAKGVESDRVVLFPNGVDLDAVKPLDRPSVIRAELGIPEHAVVALYSGNMGGKQGLEILGEVAHLLAAQPDIRFVFCGEGPTKPVLQAACRDLPNVHFLPLQPIERLSELLGAADIHLLPQRKDAADLVMPSKLTGILASGKPLICASPEDTELASVVANCGVLTPPEDAGAMADALLKLAQDPARRTVLGAAGRTYARNWLDAETIFRRFEEALLQTLPDPREPQHQSKP
jgi:colanic acid biosynthesis glycosyl transferase WcaI